MQRAVIFGGTFDPIHNGHLEAARRVQHLFAIDRMIFVPACVPPHKRQANITSAFHRFAMLALATSSDAAFEISTVELDHPQQPYAVDTVTRLQAELGSEWRLFFLMGADSWSELTTWRLWQELLRLCSPIVVTRPGHEVSIQAPHDVTTVCDVRGLVAEQIVEEVERNVGPGTFITDASMTDVSATAIRHSIHAGDEKEFRNMVPQLVADYIEKHRLYKK